MQNRYFERIKLSKPFKKFDILIYAFIVLFLILLFLFCIILPNKKNIDGFKITLNNELVLTYIFNKDIDISSKFKENVEIDLKDGNTYIKLFTDAKKEDYNTICVNLENNDVTIIEANCSSSHDCTLFPPLKKGGSIICLPHKLKVLPLNNQFSEPVVGG